MQAKCKVCKDKGVNTPATVMLSTYRLNLCKEHFISWVEKRTEETIKKFKMFGKKQKLLVAVSGGKDSLNLWYILNKLGYDADGFYIDLGIEGYSNKSKIFAQNMAERIDKKLIIIDMNKEISDIISLSKKTKKPVCSVCGTVKRYYFNKTAKDNGYDILVTGHNLDDEVAVLFGNTINWKVDYLRRQHPVLPAKKGFVKKVKPFCRISEKESAMYSFYSKIDYIKMECPKSIGASSIKNKQIISRIEEDILAFKVRFYLDFLTNMHPLLQNEINYEEEPLECSVCGEPSFNNVCSVCSLKEKL
ncbi:adenine nucleotide alpha hydrolase family protein [Deferribacterales bacterium Es71-Z0220]|uniref:adenine nucleotide alpha hydrolase family protein n=1 Tax=Deferrivibrio essentukiensis TaxID=2880922 RepID=UPI001F6115B8|nr:adenine nucleotide alpha hydrolase family protein [Deferrivibrio essentukiensis]MCB4203389.1 adenine nucleotide alpha hydrolase family protein [Deferrivibrio essentukiensis]